MWSLLQNFVNIRHIPSFHNLNNIFNILRMIIHLIPTYNLPFNTRRYSFWLNFPTHDHSFNTRIYDHSFNICTYNYSFDNGTYSYCRFEI